MVNQYEEKLKQYITKKHIPARHLSFTQSCHSVQEAAAAVKALPSEFVKNICMIDSTGNLVVAIVKGEDKVSTMLVAQALGVEKVRMANPEEILQRTGYPCGGTPSFGYGALCLIDERVMEEKVVYSGGGSEKSLVQISSVELQKANQGRIVRVRK